MRQLVAFTVFAMGFRDLEGEFTMAPCGGQTRHKRLQLFSKAYNFEIDYRYVCTQNHVFAA